MTEPTDAIPTTPVPVKPRRLWLWTVVAVALVAVTAGVTYALTRSSGSPAAAATQSPTATPAPTPTHLDEAAACAIAVPAARDGGQIITDFIQHPDGSTVDKPTLTETIAVLQQVQSDGPPDLQQFVSDLLDPLNRLAASFADGESRQVPTMQAALAAGAIQDKCAAYTS